MDIGASHHLTGDSSQVSKSQPYSGTDSVTVGNDYKLNIKYVGSGTLSSKSWTSFSLKALLQTLQTFTNLLSIHKLCCDNSIIIELYKIDGEVQSVGISMVTSTSVNNNNNYVFGFFFLRHYFNIFF